MPLTRREFLKLGGALAAAMSLAQPRTVFSGGEGGIPVLLYHDISDGFADPYTISPSVFAAQMEWLHAGGYRAVSLRGAGALRPGDAARTVIITFDDGYASFLDYAYPLLRGYGFTSTINIIGRYAGGFINRGGNRPMLSWDEYRFLLKEGLVELGCHTHDLHLRRGVVRFDAATLRDDLGMFNHVLGRETGLATDILAWPYGIYDHRAARVAKEAGFRYLLTSHEGYLNNGGFDEVPRLNISNRLDMVSFGQYLGGL